jgi:hypothetical protein
VLEAKELKKLLYGEERFGTLSYGRLATGPAPNAPAVRLDTRQ